LKPEEMVEAGARIDDAARAAGRDPAAIRRLLNVGANLSAEQFAELALAYGFDTFMVGGWPDDSDGLQRFIENVAPKVRELVAAGRESK
jgi:alkanesulfonate monooxygenase SsuD/methylene tetrahydromethanopterin reductase-like flavin-dependent oxidoreductase (luciferase family)